MATKQQVLDALGATGDHIDAARRLGIPPGQVHLVASGVPADGTRPDDVEDRDGFLDSPQRLVNDRHHNPLRDPRVDDWVRMRAARDLTPGR